MDFTLNLPSPDTQKALEVINGLGMLSYFEETIPSANDIFSNEISDNDVGTRRRDRVVGNTHYLVNKGRSNRNIRKLPNYHFTVGKFPTNPFTALKRKLSARSKKDKKRKRHYIRPWHSKKLPSDPVTVGSNAISKLAR